MGHRFNIASQSIRDNRVELDEKESRHAIKVLRLEPGAAVELLDGKGRSYAGFIAQIRSGRVVAAIRTRSRDKTSANTQINLAISVIKPLGMDLLIQKACELGAWSIQPLICERTVVRISPERMASKEKRWRKIAAESCKQCGQAFEPVIHSTRRYDDFLKTLSGYDLILFPTMAVKTISLSEALKKNSPKKVIVFIGPEGDFTPSEAELAQSCGAIAVSLGERIMRSETAAMHLVSILDFFYNRAK
ncbi:MAG: 16S rRNA (uracil(1498)-N(3))-methyltransferase [Candidatus Omnitrophica bacterium]|nr:16S rRNA (uracil(1498)-N(3))-methyltransferase [Candidatus Omnitrophota bacterium]